MSEPTEPKTPSQWLQDDIGIPKEHIIVAPPPQNTLAPCPHCKCEHQKKGPGYIRCARCAWAVMDRCLEEGQTLQAAWNTRAPCPKDFMTWWKTVWNLDPYRHVDSNAAEQIWNAAKSAPCPKEDEGEETEKLLKALEYYATVYRINVEQGNYYLCKICSQEATSLAEIKHRSNCPLATGKPEPSSDIEKVQGPMGLDVILDQIEQRANAATAGPWDDVAGEGDFFGETLIQLADTYENWREDVAFIAAARSDVPALVKALRHAVKFITDNDHEAEFRLKHIAKLLNAPSLPERVSSPEEEEKK